MAEKRQNIEKIEQLTAQIVQFQEQASEFEKLQATVQRLVAENSEISEKLKDAEKGPKIELPEGLSEEEIKKELETRLKPKIESELKSELESSVRQNVESEIRAELAPKLEAEIRSDLEENVLVALEEELRQKIEEEIRGQTGSTAVNLEVNPETSVQPPDYSEEIAQFHQKISELEQQLQAANQLQSNSNLKLQNLTEDLESTQSQAQILLQQLNENQELNQKNLAEKKILEEKISELENRPPPEPVVQQGTEPVPEKPAIIDRSGEIEELLSKLSLATKTIEEQKVVSDNVTKGAGRLINTGDKN